MTQKPAGRRPRRKRKGYTPVREAVYIYMLSVLSLPVPCYRLTPHGRQQGSSARRATATGVTPATKSATLTDGAREDEPASALAWPRALQVGGSRRGSCLGRWEVARGLPEGANPASPAPPRPYPIPRWRTNSKGALGEPQSPREAEAELGQGQERSPSLNPHPGPPKSH